MAERKISLCAVPYRVTEADGQVIFENESGFAGTYSRFTFEWRGCGWYLVGYEDWVGQVFVPHLVAAFKWVEENYSVTWNDGVGVVTLLGGPSNV